MNVLYFVINALMEDIMSIIKVGFRNLMNVQIQNVIVDVNKKNYFIHDAIIIFIIIIIGNKSYRDIVIRSEIYLLL